MPDEEKVEELTKQKYRRRTWDEMKKNGVGHNPASDRRHRRMPRLPKFVGAEDAAKRLADLAEFKNAKVIKLNPDEPQEPVRLMALKAGKEILIPIPRLKSGLFLHVTPPENQEEIDSKIFTSKQELVKHGKPLGLDADIKVDLVVMGTLCVNRLGHRIGKGEGFSDLEFAMMMRMGAINQNTVVVTTVHDCQIVDDLPPGLVEKHDVPVDIIVTPTQTIFVTERLRKPDEIFWDILTMRRIKSMQILQQLKEMDEKEGKEITLKPDDPNHSQRWKRYDSNSSRKRREKAPSKSSSQDNHQDLDQEENKNRESENGKSRPARKRRTKSKKNDKTDSPEDEQNNEKPEKSQRPKKGKYKPRSGIDFSLKLSNIGSDVRVRDLKNALIERGVRPTDITWCGYRGFCYLHFGKLRNKNSVPNEPVQVDSIVANLQQLRVGEESKNTNDEYIIVEPAKPITRIEITDVTAV
ncbi:5-formyltetrahydrofolate cyclo-ligase-like protein COG0212 isoform X1 [Fopius arisanus]|uniref:Methenyltetrahydrofolate synthase domain-containing protein n=2 Tax=Fopius arisanus TaxID=64838 RepID=A0A9R1TNG2_9HYME|nr:PREDICTED: 5-formyltetrahydrofolate cyclo-ligase-like protein COG0212 isoform X1 [Fopius arisanus]